MAVAKSGGAYWERTGVVIGTEQTWLGWVRPDLFAPNNDYRTVLAQDGGEVNWLGVYQDTAGGIATANLWVNSFDGPIVEGPALALDEYLFLAVVRSGDGSSWKLAWRWEGDPSLNTATGTEPDGPTTIGQILKIGAEHGGNAPLAGGYAHWRVIPAALSDSQILAESASPVALQTAWADWPLEDVDSDEDDISGNNRPLTLLGLDTGAHTNTTGPDITIPGGDGTAQPAPIAVITSTPAAALAVGATTTPAAVAAAAALPGPAPAGGATAAGAVVIAPATLPEASLTAGAVAQPAPTSASATLPAAITAAGGTTQPDPIASAATLPPAELPAGSTAAPNPVTGAVTLPEATGTGGASDTATPGPLAAPVTLPAAGASGAAATTPDPISAATTLPPALASGGQNAAVTPGPVAAALAVLAAAASAGAGPSTLLAGASIPAATTPTGAGVTPAAVALAVLLPQATAGDLTPAPEVADAGTWQEPAPRTFREHIGRSWREP